MSQNLDSSILGEFDRQEGIRHGLPGAAYLTEEFAKLEDDYLFPSAWAFIGFAHELANIGDAIPIQIAGQPLLMVKNEANEINVFHNICQHRHLQLVDEATNCGKLIRCAYHCWSYDLNGRLKSAPYFTGETARNQENEDFKLEDNGLTAVRSGIWNDWIFVNLDGKAEPFEDFIQPLKKLAEDIDFSRYKPVSMLDLGVVSCNWKLLMENFIKPYHVQFVHKTTTDQPLEDHYPVLEGNCLGSAVDLTEEQVATAEGAGTLAVSSRYLTLFPNFVMGTYQPDQIGVHLNTPLDSEHTSQRRAIYVHEDASYSYEQIQQLHDLWHSVHLEDHAICKRLQEGRRSQLANSGGLLSPQWETSVRKFQELVANAIRPGLTS